MQTNLAATRIGLIGNTSVINVQNEMAAARAQPPAGLTIFQSGKPLVTVDDIPTVIDDLTNTYRVDALYVCTDPLITSSADILNEWARLYKLKTMHTFGVNRGKETTMPYWGPSFTVLFNRAADFVYNWSTTGARPPWEPADTSKFDHYP